VELVKYYHFPIGSRFFLFFKKKLTGCPDAKVFH
jgi:hypothetical protein